METWVPKLREQTAQIAAGDYSPSATVFAQAPACISDLSRDLDDLAQMIAGREVARKTLAMEVHHRVKNNLQIVTSLLNMQVGRIENPAAREALGQTRARIGAIALIHRILYETADDGSQASLDISHLFHELCAQFHLWNRNRKGIRLTCEASAHAVPLDSALPLALFTVEAVTNAYSYAFPQGRSGTIVLDYEVADGGEARLCVTDNGAGFDNISHNQSMGHQLMHGFADQLGGSFKIISSAEKGTEVRLDYQLTALESPA